MAEAFVYHLQPMVAEMKQGLSIKIIYTDIYRNKHFKKKRNEACTPAPVWPFGSSGRPSISSACVPVGKFSTSQNISILDLVKLKFVKL